MNNNQIQPSLKWHFPNLDHGEADGFNDPLLNYFEGSHEKYVARESIQNSIDAKNEALGESIPVIVRFDYKKMQYTKIPGINELKKRIEICFQKSLLKQDKKAIAFFQDAMSMIGKKEIPILRISDYNTKGLMGEDDDETGSWHKLVKAVGENRMSGSGGGSFGIGKGAPIAASSLHTVLYSTYNIDGCYIFQGKTKLITHDYDNIRKRGVGFYGVNGYTSARNINEIPEGYLRNTAGTDVDVLGYKPTTEDWSNELIKSVLDNFWMAIHSGILVAQFADESCCLEINKKNLIQFLEKYSPEKAKPYYLAVINHSHIMKKETLPILKECELYILQDAAYIKKRKIVFMRLPKMVVEEKQFALINDGFVGVFICNNNEGNRILRDMEPPEHDKWDDKRPYDKKRAKQARDEIREWIKSSLKEISFKDSTSPEEIPELDQFLPLENDDEPGLGNQESKTLNGVQTEETAREVGARKEEPEQEIQITLKPNNEIHSAVAGGVYEGHSKPKQHNPGPFSEPSHLPTDPKTAEIMMDGEMTASIDTTKIKFRFFAKETENNEIEYIGFIDSLIDQTGAVRMVAAGDDVNSDESTPIKEIKSFENNEKLECSGSVVKNLRLLQNHKTKIRLVLKNSKIKYALRMERYEK